MKQNGLLKKFESQQKKSRARGCAARLSSGLAPGGLMTQGKRRQNYALRKFNSRLKKIKSINFSHTRGVLLLLSFLLPKQPNQHRNLGAASYLICLKQPNQITSIFPLSHTFVSSFCRCRKKKQKRDKKRIFTTYLNKKGQHYYKGFRRERGGSSQECHRPYENPVQNNVNG